jgi:hypothetical protein
VNLTYIDFCTDIFWLWEAFVEALDCQIGIRDVGISGLGSEASERKFESRDLESEGERVKV